MIYKLFLPLLFIRTVNTVTHSYDTSTVLSLFLLAEDRQKPDRHEYEFICFGKKCESASDKLHAAVYNFTITFNSHIK